MTQTPIGFGAGAGHRKWQLILKGKEGTIVETVTQNAYRYDWTYIASGGGSQLEIVSPHRLSKDEVDAQMLAKEERGLR
jgi:hypothetical protein